MRLLLDENAARRTFVRLLNDNGHEVEVVTKALAPAASDKAIVAYALRSNRVIVTQDTDDFTLLYGELASHPGLILIYPASALQPVARLAATIDNVAQTYSEVNNMVLVLHEFSGDRAVTSFPAPTYQGRKRGAKPTRYSTSGSAKDRTLRL